MTWLDLESDIAELMSDTRLELRGLIVRQWCPPGIGKGHPAYAKKLASNRVYEKANREKINARRRALYAEKRNGQVKVYAARRPAQSG